ncbi:MAG: homoserine kinase [Clostridiales bacterium]|jgi:homoserine kinase|nr:homoserine kinase [Clostridiales bacterium]
MIRIQVPATSANLGSGFDALGLALSLYNQVWMEESDRLDISSADHVAVPTDASNLIYVAAKQLYEMCGKPLSGLKIIQENNIPMASGMGSSSACIVAGMVGANHLLGSPLSPQELIEMAANLEGHPDNTSPALSGGLTVSAMDEGKVYSVRLPVADTLRFAVFVPSFELKTEEARSVLPHQYSRTDVVYNLSRSALMAAALSQGDLKSLRVAVQDRIHQPYRAKLIPGFDVLSATSYELGSLGTYISGAGPTIVAIIAPQDAKAFEEQALLLLKNRGVTGWGLKILGTDPYGARVFPESSEHSLNL